MLGFSQVQSPEFLKAQQDYFKRLLLLLKLELEGPKALLAQEIRKMHKWDIISGQKYAELMAMHNNEPKLLPGMPPPSDCFTDKPITQGKSPVNFSAAVSRPVTVRPLLGYQETANRMRGLKMPSV